MVDLITWAVSIGAAICILTGFGLGVIGDDVAKKRAKARAKRLGAQLGEERGLRRAAEAARERAEARAAVATAARDEFRDQLALAEEALAKVTYTNAPGRAPEPEEGPEDDAPRGAHHRPEPEPCRSITTNPFYAGGLDTETDCEHDDGQDHDGRHTAYDGDVEWDDDGGTWVHGERL